MKKSKSKNAQAGFWKPEKIGEKLEGNFICFSQSEKGVVLNLTSGAIGINSKPLKDKFKKIYSMLTKKDVIKIVFIGFGKHKILGNYPRLFEVQVNGEKIENDFIPIEMTPKELENFFEA